MDIALRFGGAAGYEGRGWRVGMVVVILKGGRDWGLVWFYVVVELRWWMSQ